MDRIAVVGNSGSGKSTVARRISATLDMPVLELDSIVHLAGWTEIGTEEFREKTASFVVTERWVVDGNYRSRVGDLIWKRADTVIWLDLSRPVVMRQLVGRTLSRVVNREELWNGNRESWRNLIRWDPAHSVLRWSWTQHANYRDIYSRALSDPANARLQVVRLRTRRDITRWLDSLQNAAPPHT